MNALANAITRIGIFALAFAMVLQTNNPVWLWLIALCIFTRNKKPPRRQISEEFDALHARLDAMSHGNSAPPPNTP